MFKKNLSTIIGVGLTSSLFTALLFFASGADSLNLPKQIEVKPQQQTTSVEKTSSQQATSLPDMIEQATNSIVGVTNYQQSNQPFAAQHSLASASTGSGVIYKKEGSIAYVITNNHVIENADEIEVTFANGEKANADLIGRDALTDLALLKVKAKFAGNPLPFGKSSNLRTGDPVIAIGSPLNLEFSGTATQGIVSSPSRTIDIQTSAGPSSMNVIQTDAAINPGNSGGALLNEKGEVIGINTLKVAKEGFEGIGFAIPSDEVQPLIKQLEKHGTIKRPTIGVTLVDISSLPITYKENLPENMQQGAMIVQVAPDSPAAQAGLKAQDIITAINETPIKHTASLRQYLYTHTKINEPVTLTIYREGKKIQIELTVAVK